MSTEPSDSSPLAAASPDASCMLCGCLLCQAAAVFGGQIEAGGAFAAAPSNAVQALLAPGTPHWGGGGLGTGGAVSYSFMEAAPPRLAR